MPTVCIESVLNCKIALGICAYHLSTKGNNYLRKRKRLLDGNSDEDKTSECNRCSHTMIYNIP